MYVIVHTWEPLSDRRLFFTPSKGNFSNLFIAEAYSDDFSSTSVLKVEGNDTGGQCVL